MFRLKELEAAAEQLQAALLAELNAPAAGAGASTKRKGKAKKAKKKQVGIMARVQAALQLYAPCFPAVIKPSP